ncbi:hypothetical protein ANN_01309 [Periplaneta americana]|uniref:Uncharacterized protein n=1 Tax=Periplaneta americana TaxID=6978 RepID=A0ABQ8TUA4_PERAM|nr:hypothetical protein ANN_01309 [Periplaneta americana]
MEEEEEEVKSASGQVTKQQQHRTFQQSTRMQQSYSSRTTMASSSSKTISSGIVSSFTSDVGDKNIIQEESSRQSMSFKHFISSSSTKTAINKPQGRLTHMIACDKTSEDGSDTVSNPNGQELLGIATEETAEAFSSAKMMQASNSSFMALAQEKQKYGSISSHVLSSGSDVTETSAISAAESTVTMATSLTKDTIAQNQGVARAKSPMMYLSASQEDYENAQHKRTLSRSLSPMSSTSSDVSAPGLSPARTLSTAKSVETSAIGREGRQWLTATSGTYRSETAKSMESLRSNSTASSSSGNVHHTHRHSFLTSSERDMRRVVASSVEARSLENLEKEIRLMGKRKAVSGEELIGGADDSSMTPAERRRGLYAGVITPGERRTTVPQHLSLPPPRALT